MKADTRTEKEVTAVLHAFMAAYQNRDLQALLSTCAKDPDVMMYGTGADEKRIGIAGIQAQAERDWAQSDSAGLEADWVSVSSAGDVAWVAADCTFHVGAGGQQLDFPARLTGVLERRNGEWLIMQMHFSMPSAGQEEGESF